ncbi:helix-turn-helix domain-containing protein [Paraconexibacter antarcticus]|uniref:Helix-turn-helix domain-containing protein n=1 Tax=Paraconexibacter antarcticus TaxID=2949664 RepID=A0ABY5DNE6_9ACTN|nr:helix-turn-helix domain-containing protein [Paraconexibacter antarcticus]UTI62337.1 helix-turn-helix domain-containing protein [Paraconexibacter antarcticus]
MAKSAPPAARPAPDDGIREAASRLAVDVCRVLDIARCSVWLREPGEERFRGVAAHPAAELERDVRRLRIGGEHDAITRDIVAGAAPVFIRDTAADPRTSLMAIRHWHVRTLLGLPLSHDGEVIGVAMVDNGQRAYPYRPEQMAAAAALADAAGAAIGRAREARQLRAQMETVARQNRLLRDASTADQRLAQIVLTGGGLGAIAGAVAELTGKPVALYDTALHVVAAAPAPRDAAAVAVHLLDDPAVRAAVLPELAALKPGACQPVGPLLSVGMRLRHLVAPVDLVSGRWGHLVVMEHRSRLTSLDEYTTRRAAAHVALELAAEERATVGARDARSALAEQLVGGVEDARALRRSADYLGVALDVERVAVVVLSARAPGAGAGPGGDVPDLDARAHGIATAVAAATGREVLDTGSAEGVVLLVETTPGLPGPTAAADVRAAVVAALGGEVADEATRAVGISTRFARATDAAGAFREAREVAGCAARLATGAAAHPVLTADELGPGRLFLTQADPVALARFVAATLGPLLTAGDGMPALLHTLEVFFATTRSVRRSAQALGVHENTVRQRLERIARLTGLDVAGDATDQLSVQIALLIRRVTG